MLIIGSGAIKIAEAAEFDYSGSQALTALKELGIKTIIMNPNIATFQTSYSMANKVYTLPLTQEYAERVIENEKPDGILAGFGGQTALSLGLKLWKSGFLKKKNVKFLGTNVKGIEAALSRSKFHALMRKKGIKVPTSIAAKSIGEARIAANKIGFPVMCRVSFNLGGRGSMIAKNTGELETGISKAFAQSEIKEVLIEKYLEGWKEIEYEVVRDCKGNSAVIACLENMDPMGIHTGESVVVAPQQTLDNYIYQEMRSIAIKVAESIDLIGECNVQFAVDPNSYSFYVIETNPRMSRSSALASKVTGYPLAYVAAKLSMGLMLPEIRNDISGVTKAFFEPSLDYITVKMPRWDIEKFVYASDRIGSEMKSIGEVMGIGANLGEAMQKAARMLDIGESGIISINPAITSLSKEGALSALRERKPYWFLYASQALLNGASINEVSNASKVNIFFISEIYEITKAYEEYVKANTNDRKSMLTDMHRLGFSMQQLGHSREKKPRLIDTLAGEWPSNANYAYLTGAPVLGDKIKSKNEA